MIYEDYESLADFAVFRLLPYAAVLMTWMTIAAAIFLIPVHRFAINGNLSYFTRRTQLRGEHFFAAPFMYE